MCKLKAKKEKEFGGFKVEITCIVEVGSFNIPNPYLSPLANPFVFNLSFSILSDVISDNTPISFL